MKKIKFLGLEFNTLTKRDVLKEEDFFKFIVPVNAEIIVKANQHSAFKHIINHNYATFDGQVPYLLARLQNPKLKFEKLSGSDLIYDFCHMARNEKRTVFLLGGYEKSNRDAVSILRQNYNIVIDGFSPVYKPYPFTKHHNQMILDILSQAKAEILFVGFGAMKQELWIKEHQNQLESMGIKWVIASGGTFEFVSGRIKRSPKLLQKVGLEGLFRFLMEPSKQRFQRLVTSFRMFKYL
ncbi:MAG: Unknown protein [uncultured Sulfurovum sp.]|uniref:N-acetylmannosaminyltransferase (EC) n=1 Tax=uncultured Sulfurovum sp. TaxID=269237 RepID=A0A6S6SSH0_9BACT|nr:MAG: Unknown protein [uncultured Sulfurovum sp.]